MSAVFVYITTSSIDEAMRLGRAAVEEGLAACANALPHVRSIYRWQGKIEEAEESVLILKSTDTQSVALTARMQVLHGAEIPGIVVVPIISGNPRFLDWIAAETR